MDIGGLITFLIVVIYIVSVFLKFGKKFLKDGKIDVASVLDKIKQMQTGVPNDEIQTDTEKTTPFNKQQVQAAAALNKNRVSLNKKQVKPDRRKNISDKKMYEKKELQAYSYNFYQPVRKFELKKAVIFSEIIGTPLGLRKESNYDKF